VCTDIRWKENANARRLVIAAYGGKCACCAEETPEFLTLDHIANNGAAHRRELLGRNIAGNVFYKKLQSLGFPPCGLQVLCWNCNTAKQFHGGCPHRRATSSTIDVEVVHVASPASER
jgi:hypothetical protein